MARCPSCGSRMRGDTCPRCGPDPTPVLVLHDEEETRPPERAPSGRGVPVRAVVVGVVALVVVLAGIVLLSSGSSDDGAAVREEAAEDPTGKVFALVGSGVEVVDDQATRRSSVVDGSYTDALVVGDRVVALSDRPGEVVSAPVEDASDHVRLGMASWMAPAPTEGRVWLGPDDEALEVDVRDGAVHRRVPLGPEDRFLADLGGPTLVSERVGPAGAPGELNLRITHGDGPEFPRTAQYVAARPGLVATLRCGEGCALHLTPVGGDGRERTLAGEGIRTWNRGSFSPDGELLVAMRRVDEGEAVTVTNPAEEWSRSYVLGAGYTTAPVWSADSRSLFVGFGPDSDSAADRIVAFNRDAGFSFRTLSIVPREPFTSMSVR